MPLLTRMTKPPSEGHLLAPQYQDLAPEAIYDDLLRNPKAAKKLITFAGEGVPDILGMSAESGPSATDRLLLDALLRGYQVHSESGKGELPHTLLDAIRRLEHPPPPWDVLLGRWFDEHVPPVERIRTYGRPSRRQSATPTIARPRYVWPDEENVQRGTFGLVLDTSGSMPPLVQAQALGAITAYALSRNISLIRVLTSGAELEDRGNVAAESLAQPLALSARSSATLQPALNVLEKARDFPEDAPILLVTGVPCDRIKTQRDHAFLIPDGGRLTYQTAAPVIEIAEIES